MHQQNQYQHQPYAAYPYNNTQSSSIAPGIPSTGNYHHSPVGVGTGMHMPAYGEMYGPPSAQAGIGFANRSHQYSPSNSQQLEYPPLNRGSSQSSYDSNYGVMGTPQVMSSIPPVPPRSRGSSNIELDSSAYPPVNLLHQSPQNNLHAHGSPNIYSSPQQSSLGYHPNMAHLGGVNANDYAYMSAYEPGSSFHEGGHDFSNHDSHYIDGAVHLSAGAKPFIPKYASSPASSVPIPSLDRTDSSGLSRNPSSFSLPPLSVPIQQRSPETPTWAPPQEPTWNPPRRSPEISLSGFVNEPSDHSLDNLIGPLDMLSFDGIVNRMAMPGLDSDLSVDLGESLLERLAVGSTSSDRRRNRGLLFQAPGSSLNFDISDETKLGDEDVMLPFNQFISDVIDSPDMHSSYPSRLFDHHPS